MLGYLSTNEEDITTNYLNCLDYLLGNFNVALYMYQSDFWTKIGAGKSTILCKDKLMSEEIEIVKGDEVISMSNTFGYDTKDVYKLLNLNLSTGTMDVYKGKVLDESLVFNSESVPRSIDGSKTPYTFKMIYNQLSKSENQVVVGRSKDDGRTWIPFIKTLYKRK